MKDRRVLWGAMSLLVVFVSCGMSAQTANGSKKNCVPPRVIYSPEPAPSYYSKKDSAVAVLNVLVDEKGQVSDTKVVRSSGSDDFDRDALSTVRNWRFKPASCDGKALPAHMNVEIISSVTH
jgi:protein TonB